VRNGDKTRNVLAAGHDPELSAARVDAHRYLDPLWQFGLMTRGQAYERLAKRMGLPLKQCHIRLMTKEQALAVREHAAAIRREATLEGMR